MKDHIVILLHGIGHPLHNMVLLENECKREGFSTLNISYPSTKLSIDDLTSWLDKKLKDNNVFDYERVHFVTLSMGSLVTADYLDGLKEQKLKDKIGRAVMLGPPLNGSEVADLFQSNPLYKFTFGPAGQDLTTKSREEKQFLPWYELGIIAAENPFNPLLSLFQIKGAGDGCVSIESTMMKGMKDHIIVTALHGFIGWHKPVRDQVICFLQTGSFKRSDN